jgi:hypothetical protein
LTEAQLASHSHVISTQCGINTCDSVEGVVGNVGGGLGGAAGTSTAGSNASHTHTLSGVAASGNFTSNFAVKYVNMIVATKN